MSWRKALPEKEKKNDIDDLLDDFDNETNVRAGKKLKNKDKRKIRDRLKESGIDFQKMFDDDRLCGCFGSIHDVLNNCTNCGRIICKVEGERPCPFCGRPVFSDETLGNVQRVKELTDKFNDLVALDNRIFPMEMELQLSKHIEKVTVKLIDYEKDFFEDDFYEENIVGVDCEEEEEVNNNDNTTSPE